MLFSAQLNSLRRYLPWVAIGKRQQSLRMYMEQRRRILSAEQVLTDSAAIVSRLEELSIFQEAHSILLYYPIRNEVDLRPLLERYANKKTLLLPVTHSHSRMDSHPYYDASSLRKGNHFPIPEPITPPYTGSIDLILVPGVVFDSKGHRIGRGGGYYDRFLRRHPESVTIGISYDFQVYKHSIPQSFHDHRLDGLVTPTRTLLLKRER